MLTDELGTASHIKDRVNRLSVIEAITSTQQKLKLYSKVPDNGLVVYCGKIGLDDNKSKRVTIAFEPFKPVSRSIYHCDNRFHTEQLSELLTEDKTFGFIIMDGNGCLFATLQGSTKHTLHKFSVDLPKKHGRGGQSALRFARLRLEKRGNYLKKVAELARAHFIGADHKCSVEGLILAGSADFKEKLFESANFDPILRKSVLKIVDISYGMEPGLHQAMELAAGTLSNVTLVQEKILLQSFFGEVAQDSGKVCYMIQDSLTALEMGAVETLIVWENLDVIRYQLRNSVTGVESVVHLTPAQAAHPHAASTHFRAPPPPASTPADGASTVPAILEVVAQGPLSEWLAEHYQQWGANLVFVSDRSPEGHQFCRGFGGLGGTLRWPVSFAQERGEGGEDGGRDQGDGIDSDDDEDDEGESFYKYEEDFI